ncbi:MAG: Tim44/TimA family putative adaptor protein [Pseudomonadota bacterium]
MNGFFDIYSLIFLVLAIAIFFRLRSVLGKRTGNERPPFDPISHREQDRSGTGRANNENVISLPNSRDTAKPEPAEAVVDELAVDANIDKIAPAGTPLNAALKSISAADSSFDAKEFIGGARMAYEMIVVAFAEGDRKTLKQLLTREVYDGFNAAITDRESRNETADTTFVGIDKAELSDAVLKNGQAQVTVRFQSQLISATRDKNGAVIDGDPNKVIDVTDVWTFARDVNSRDPNWHLIATESAD